MEDHLGAVAEPDRPALLRGLLAADLNARRLRSDPAPGSTRPAAPSTPGASSTSSRPWSGASDSNSLYFLHGFMLESCSKARSPMSTSCELWFCTTARTWSTTLGPTATAGDDPADSLTTCVRTADVLI